VTNNKTTQKARALDLRPTHKQRDEKPSADNKNGHPAQKFALLPNSRKPEAIRYASGALQTESDSRKINGTLGMSVNSKSMIRAENR